MKTPRGRRISMDFCWMATLIALALIVAITVESVVAIICQTIISGRNPQGQEPENDETMTKER